MVKPKSIFGIGGMPFVGERPVGYYRDNEEAVE
jgi:hypothetical protein